MLSSEISDTPRENIHLSVPIHENSVPKCKNYLEHLVLRRERPIELNFLQL